MSQRQKVRFSFSLAVAALVVGVAALVMAGVNFNQRDIRGALVPAAPHAAYMTDATLSGGTTTGSVQLKVKSTHNDLSSFQFVVKPATAGLDITNVTPGFLTGTAAGCAMSSYTATEYTSGPLVGAWLVQALEGFGCTATVDTTATGGALIANVDFSIPATPGTYEIAFEDGSFSVPGAGTGYSQFLYPAAVGTLIPELSDETLIAGGAWDTNDNYNAQITYTAAPALSVNVSPASIAEQGAGSAVTVTISPAPASSVVVSITLTPSIPALSGLPLTVTVPAGGGASSSAPAFTLTQGDDGNTGNETATLTATGPAGGSYTPVTANINTVDNDSGLSFNAANYSVVENATATAVTVTAAPTPAAPTVVTLSLTGSGTPPVGLATTPAGPFTAGTGTTVTVSPTASSQTFYMKALDDANTVNETGISLNAAATGYSNISVPVSVIDDDIVNITSVDIIPMPTGSTYGAAGAPVYFPYYGVKAQVNTVGAGTIYYDYTWASTGLPTGAGGTYQTFHTVCDDVVPGVTTSNSNIFIGNNGTAIWARSDIPSQWTLTVVARLGSCTGTATSPYVTAFNIVNDVPNFTSLISSAAGGTWNNADTVYEVLEGATNFQYNAQATDIENDNMVYGIISVVPGPTPAGLQISTTPTTSPQPLTWLSPYPTEGRVGDMVVTLSADDQGFPGSDSQAFTLRVKNVNNKPVITHQTYTSGQNIFFTEGSTANIVFNVADGDALPPTFPQQVVNVTAAHTPVGLPAWITYDDLTRTITANPANANVGNTGTITLTGVDALMPTPNNKWDSGTPQTSTPFVLNYTVIDNNDPPVISSSFPSSFPAVNEDTAMVMNLNAFEDDPDLTDNNAELTWSIISAGTNSNIGTGGGTIFDFPADVTVDNANDRITITPNANAYGTTTLTLQLSDDQLATDTATVVITWNPVNDAPMVVTDPAYNGNDINSIEPVTGTEDPPAPLTVNLAPYKYDVDDTPVNLTYSVGSSDFNANQIQSASFSGNTLSVMPKLNFTGNTNITIHLKDDDNAEGTYSLPFTFTNTPDLPVWLDWPGNVTGSHVYDNAYAGALYIFPLEPNVNDPDPLDHLYFDTDMLTPCPLTSCFTYHTTPSGIHQYRWIPGAGDVGTHTFKMYASNNASVDVNSPTANDVPAGYSTTTIPYTATVNVLPASNAPQIVYIRAVDPTHVEFTYNMSADLPHGSPEDENKYSITGGLTDSLVSAQNNVDFVMTTSTQTPGQVYTLNITGVRFSSGVFMNNYSINFTGYGTAGSGGGGNGGGGNGGGGNGGGSSSGLLGDANESNSVTSADALLVLQYYVGLKDNDDLDLCLSDANESNNVTSADALKILEDVVGLEDLGNATCS